MVVSALLYLVFYVVNVLTTPLQLLSDVSANSTFVQGITNSTHYLATFNNFVPLSDIVIVLSLIISIEIILASYKIIMWVVRRLPTQS